MRNLKGLNNTAHAIDKIKKTEMAGVALMTAALPLGGMAILGAQQNFAHRAVMSLFAALAGEGILKYGDMKEKKLLARLILKPRTARELALGVKNPISKRALYVFGHAKFNETEREAISKVISGKADNVDKNRAERAFTREEIRMAQTGEIENFLGQEYLRIAKESADLMRRKKSPRNL